MEGTKETEETKETKGKTSVDNSASWRGIATVNLADTADHPCNSVAIYLCVHLMLLWGVVLVVVGVVKRIIKNKRQQQ